MAGPHRRTGFVRSQRRSTLWTVISPFTATLASTGGVLILSATAALLALRPFTIIRTYLEMNIQSDQFAATEDQVGAVGLAVVSDESVTQGVVALPTPVTEAESDFWFLHQWMLSSLQFGSAIGVQTPAGRQYSIASKAMRKVNNDQDVALVAERSAIGGGFELLGAGRMLIKLH